MSQLQYFERSTISCISLLPDEVKYVAKEEISLSLERFGDTVVRLEITSSAGGSSIVPLFSRLNPGMDSKLVCPLSQEKG